MQPRMKVRRLPFVNKANTFDLAAAVLLLGLAVLIVLTYGSYGISNDEPAQQHYGEMILRYYASGFTDRALYSYDNLYLYGGLFDVLATLIAKLVPLGVYSVRHILCAVVGIGGIAATWATARLIAGPRAGLIAAVALAVCGVWYGAIFNHTKDITFAAAMIGATCMLLRVARDLPRPRLRDVVLLGLLTGAALGLRALGLFLVGYLGVAILVEAMARGGCALRERALFVARSLVALAPALVLAYLIMIAAWPWAALEPLNPVRALVQFSEFHYPIRTLLAGQVYTMGEVPRWYIPAYLLIRLPLLVLGGFALALIFAATPRLASPAIAPRARREICFVAFTTLFPVLCHVIEHGPAFTGLRHFLFVVPGFAVLAGIGFDSLVTRLAQWRPPAAAGAGAALAAALVWNAGVLVRLHPYEYLDYNSIVGGLRGAAGRYETDYWVNMMPDAVRQLDKFLAGDQHGGPPVTYEVAVCSEHEQFEEVASPRMQYTTQWPQADFFIAPTHMNCDKVVQGKVIARIERFGALIGVVKDRRAITRPELARRPLDPKEPVIRRP